MRGKGNFTINLFVGYLAAVLKQIKAVKKYSKPKFFDETVLSTHRIRHSLKRCSRGGAMGKGNKPVPLENLFKIQFLDALLPTVCISDMIYNICTSNATCLPT